MMQVCVVGSGIIGASVAYALCQSGAAVTVLDRGRIGGVATAASFGWINASFAESDAYFDLRHAAIGEFQELSLHLDLQQYLSWNGALWWEDSGTDFDAQFAELSRRGYPAQFVDRDAISTLEPNLCTPPDCAIFTRQEGACDAQGVAQALLAASAKMGAVVVAGCEVQAILNDGKTVRTPQGDLHFDHVVVAAGGAASRLLETQGIDVPMSNHPGMILHSLPTKPAIHRVIMGSDVHFRQNPNGSFVVGEIFSGDLDADVDAVDLAHDVMRRLSKQVVGGAPQLGHICLGQRPVPADGFPIVHTGGNLSYVVTHSGVTLGPLLGKLMAAEILQGVQSPLLTDFRPTRFPG